MIIEEMPLPIGSATPTLSSSADLGLGYIILWIFIIIAFSVGAWVFRHEIDEIIGKEE